MLHVGLEVIFKITLYVSYMAFRTRKRNTYLLLIEDEFASPTSLIKKDER